MVDVPVLQILAGLRQALAPILRYLFSLSEMDKSQAPDP